MTLLTMQSASPLPCLAVPVVRSLVAPAVVFRGSSLAPAVVYQLCVFLLFCLCVCLSDCLALSLSCVY